jgi:phosphoglycerate dehydrogenase-like enzyme
VAPPVIHELAGATMGVIGLGHIGRSVTRAAHALDLRVVAVNRSPVPELPPDVAPDAVLPWEELPALLDAADIVVLAIALTDETRGLIGKAELARMGPGAFLINPARGGLLDEEALYVALRDGVIAGAALDAWWNEPHELTTMDPSRFPFGSLPNVILSPHNAGGTVESFARNRELVADNIDRLFAGEPLRNLVAR